jgi:NADH-quinone oxidoreductase subunit J
MTAAIFYLLAVVILVATALAITRRQGAHAILYLIVAFSGTGALFLLLGAPLIAAFMVIIYAGAIMVLFLFVIMLFQRSSGERGPVPRWIPAVLLGIVFLAAAVTMVFKDPGSGTMLRSASVQPRDFGHFLFNRYWLAIEIVSVLLLVALVPILQFGKGKGAAGGDTESKVSPESGFPSPASTGGLNIKEEVKEGHA